MLSKFFPLFPLVLSLVAFVLSVLCLFAGHKEGFMEEYAIARLNTSMIGQNLLKVNRTEPASGDDKDGNWLDRAKDKAKDKWKDVKDDIKEGINDITTDIADELAEKIGISEWYSLHIMAGCNGMYQPNATNPDAGYNVTNCTDSDPSYRFNLIATLDHQLGVGPFQLNLNDIDWTDSLQDCIDLLNNALLALFIFYVLAAGFSGLAMFACVAAVLLGDRKAVLIGNLVLATLAAICATVGSIVITVAAKKGVKRINKLGDGIGLSAHEGTQFMTLTWITAGFMLGAMLFWLAKGFLVRRERQRVFKPRKGSY